MNIIPNRKNRNKEYTILIIILFLLSYTSYMIPNKEIQREQRDYSNLNSSIILETPIFINGTATGIGAQNWTWAKTQSWCSGEGTVGNPYKILDIIIDGDSLGSCITIVNSNAYLIIENCSVSLSGSIEGNAGVKINDSSNILIKNSTMNENGYYGLYIKTCLNITIESNNIKNNEYHGVYLEESQDISLKYNNITNNGNFFDFNTDDGDSIHSVYCNKIDIDKNNLNFNADDGVELISCLNTSIFNNKIINNYTIRTIYSSHIDGICIFKPSNYTNIRNNEIHDVKRGLVLEGKDMEIENNNISWVNDNGISVSNGFNITIKNNYLYNITDRGIRVSSGNKCFIEENTIEGVEYYGIEISSDNSTIFNNIVSNCGWGIVLNAKSKFCNISNNNIMNNGYGIYFYTYGQNYIIKNNNMTNCGILIRQTIDLVLLTSFNIDISNRVNEKAIYYYYNTTNLGFSDFNINGAPGQIILVNCNNTIITDLEISNSSDAISIFYCNNITIMNCNLSYNYKSAIFRFGASSEYKCRIINNTLSFNSQDGIASWSSGNSTLIERNFIENNKEEGINIKSGTYYIIYNNTIRNNSLNGIYIDADSTNITCNKIIGNGEYGVNFIADITKNSTIKLNTILNNNMSGIFNRNAYNCSVVDNHITNNSEYGILMLNSRFSMISYNNISFNKEYGILISNSHYSKISYNNISDNNNGVSISYCIDSLFYNNTIQNTSNGIYLNFDNDGLVISNNTLINSDITFLDDYGGGLSTLYVPLTNKINGKLIYWYTNKTNLIADNFTYLGNPGKIVLIECNNSIINNIDLIYGGGIILFSCSNITIQNNEISNNINNGIYCVSSQSIVIDNNIISFNLNGINYYNINEINITRNLINNNTRNGIDGEGDLIKIILNNILYNHENGVELISSICEINQNNISYNEHKGINLDYGDRGIIFNNSITYNKEHGLLISHSSELNISYNNIFCNDIGIIINDGYSDNNTIYLNYFIGNQMNAKDDGYLNQWDNGVIGNYWDDYVGIDSNNDGIGDIPYFINGSANSVDHFPLVFQTIHTQNLTLQIIIIIIIFSCLLIGSLFLGNNILDTIKKREEKKKLIEPRLSTTSKNLSKIDNRISSSKNSFNENIDIIDQYETIHKSKDDTYESLMKNMPYLKDYIESNKKINEIPEIHNYMMGSITPSLFKKIDLLDLTLKEKGRFIRELINLEPKERIKLIETMLKNRE
ncbi:MAG: right-handed parallel beta-helix repeat-containing protein [Candidatus Lokiarchaeota archaeon]|nr:right-handed parallel beta-helix repeat-containing protein [Candidatus Lokiarchaeota archaeon]